ncbi:putative protein kinase [Trypanosoma conorhini]|uniref:Protein kinase domain-containing protein n=1 Tax=Trypanosoma conorhini TaxID=83891 RepID=A0A3R7KZP0_9TRYP|nr:putative protein kinase [Trypanosoma conorhini]RNF16680.1 putative protein kinase [Trypanosoma conorhini]
MRRQGKEPTQRSILLPVGSFTVDAERAEEARCMGGLSPKSGGIVTPRRIVRSLNASPAVTRLVPLDGVSERPLSVETSSGTLLSEEVLEDVISEPVSATCAPREKFPALGAHGSPVVKAPPSLDPGTSASLSHSRTRGTNGDSSYSSSSLLAGSSTHMLSHDYTDVFDPESVHSCSLTGVGDKFGAMSVSHRTSTPAAAAVAVAANAFTTGAAAVKESNKETESSIVPVLAGREGSNAVEVGRRRKIINVRREERIGRGGFGDIFRAVDLDTGLPLVVKEVLVMADVGKDVEQQLRALEREIRVMRKLNHKHIVCYYSARREESNCALQIYMEYVGGGTIAQKLRANGPFSEDETRNYTRQLLEGLEYLHQRRIVHRDLKGDNLFLTEDGVLKVGDFGTSKELQTTLVTDSVAGTPNFMAPEVIACSGHSCMADIWSVGCCVLEMLTGHPPFWNLDNHMAVMFAIMKGRLEEQVPPHISANAKEFISLCLRSDPKERPSAAQLQQHLWLRCKEKDGTAESHAQSYLSLSSAELAKEHGKQMEAGEAAMHEAPPPPLSKEVFPNSTAPVVAVIAERGSGRGGDPADGPQNGDRKAKKGRQLLGPSAPSAHPSSSTTAHSSGRALYPRPPITTALKKAPLSPHVNPTTSDSPAHRNGVKRAKSRPSLGRGAAGSNGGVDPHRNGQRRNSTASGASAGEKSTRVKRHVKAGVEATTCSTR